MDEITGGRCQASYATRKWGLPPHVKGHIDNDRSASYAVWDGDCTNE